MQGPRTFLLSFAGTLHRLTVGACFVLLASSLGAQLATVVLRYGFDTGFLWLQDLALWCFSALAILAIPAGIAWDAHVRVDLIREHMAHGARWRIDVLAIILLLGPLFAVLVWLTLPEAVHSLRIGESSPQIGGLPGYWAIRFVPVLAAILALVQGAARIAARDADGAT